MQPDADFLEVVLIQREKHRQVNILLVEYVGVFPETKFGQETPQIGIGVSCTRRSTDVRHSCTPLRPSLVNSVQSTIIIVITVTSDGRFKIFSRVRRQ